jgi:hypothetical protein
MYKTYKDQAGLKFYNTLLRYCTLETYFDRDNYVQEVFDRCFDGCFSSKLLTKELIETIETENFKGQEWLTKQLLGLVQDSTAEMKEVINSFTDDERTKYLKDITAFNEEFEEHLKRRDEYNSKIHLSKSQISYLLSSDLFSNISKVVKILKNYFKDEELTANVFTQLLNMIRKLGYCGIYDQKINELEGLTEEQNKFIFDNIKQWDNNIQQWCNGSLKDIWKIAQANNYEIRDLANTILGK